jgi:hypothetical protein
VSDTLVVAKASQTITFAAVPDQIVGATFELDASASSGLPISFAAVSGPCTVSGRLVTTLAAGLCAVVARQAGDANHEAGQDVLRQVSITDTLPLITWPPPAQLEYGTPLGPEQLNATANVAGTFEYSPRPGTVLPPGTSTLTVVFRATNSAVSVSKSVSISVIVSWSGVLPPIKPDGSSMFKAGRTIPVKFRLAGAGSGIATLVARLYVAKVSDGVIGTELVLTSSSAADSGDQFRYDPLDDQYIVNLSTVGYATGTYRIRFDLGDGVLHVVMVSVTR